MIYGYATGTFGSRRIEQATYESLAFRYIAANTHPDHDTLCTFRKRFLPEIEALFVQVLKIARQMKWLMLGTVALDGTKLHANASRHSALSYGHAEKIEAQLQAEVQELLARAAAADLKRDDPRPRIAKDTDDRRERTETRKPVRVGEPPRPAFSHRGNMPAFRRGRNAFLSPLNPLPRPFSPFHYPHEPAKSPN